LTAMAAYREEIRAPARTVGYEEQSSSMLAESMVRSPSIENEIRLPIALGPGKRVYLDAKAAMEDDRYSYAAIPIADGISGYGGSGMIFSEKHHELPPITLPKEVGFVVTIVLAQFLSLASLGQGLGPRETISNDLSVTSPADQAWFSAAFSLTAGTFILVMGRLGDIYGHKRLLTSGYAVLGVCSIFAGM
jgi:hypothetical protein